MKRFAIGLLFLVGCNGGPAYFVEGDADGKGARADIEGTRFTPGLHVEGVKKLIRVPLDKVTPEVIRAFIEQGGRVIAPGGVIVEE